MRACRTRISWSRTTLDIRKQEDVSLLRKWKTYSRLLSFFAFARVCRAPLLCLSPSHVCYARTVSHAARRFLMQNYQKDVTKQTVRRRKQEKGRNYIPKNVRRTNRNKRIMWRRTKIWRTQKKFQVFPWRLGGCMTSLEEKGAKMGTFACGTEFLRGREETFVCGTEFLRGREETFACGTWFSQAKNLSLLEMTLDKEKNSLTCKKTLAKKYKYDRI